MESILSTGIAHDFRLEQAQELQREASTLSRMPDSHLVLAFVVRDEETGKTRMSGSEKGEHHSKGELPDVFLEAGPNLHDKECLRFSEVIQQTN